jgi:hypothetical protein
MKLDPQVTGNVGLYYCCYRLSLLGWNVMPTAHNARGVDIVAYDGAATRFIGVQVKALSKRDPVPLGTNLEKIMGDFWVIINNIAKDPRAFVLLPCEGKELVLAMPNNRFRPTRLPPLCCDKQAGEPDR